MVDLFDSLIEEPPVVEFDEVSHAPSRFTAMEEMWAAIIGALALVGIPLAAWLSRRFTKEGRLLLRIERLGAAHAVVPDSEQRDALGRRLLLLVTELNAWIDVPKEKLRVSQRVLALCVFLVGFAVTVAVTSHITDPTLVVVIQIVAGVVIAFASIGVSTLLERWASKGEASRLSAAATAASAERYDALMRGENPGFTNL